MIELIRQPDAALSRELTEYLSAMGGCGRAQRRHRADGLAEAGGEHDPRWLTVLHRALGHEPYLLIARRNDGSQGICGYLPMVLVASRLFGRFLVSLPYVNRAGVVADDADAAAALIDRAVQLADQLDVQYLELRRDGLPIHHPALGAQRDEKKRMLLDLPTDAAALWSSIGPKVRNQIRKADKYNLTIRWGGPQLVTEFYDIFAVNMRDLGTPVYPRKLFDEILQRFDDQAEFAVVDYEGQPIAAALLMHQADGVSQVPSASCLRRYNFTNANMWMYHQLLLRAIDRKSRQFDFGRSSEDSGTYQFKKQWGARPHHTVWQYHVRRGDMNRMRPDSPRNRRRIAVWQKLPVRVATVLGPHIVRGIP